MLETMLPSLYGPTWFAFLAWSVCIVVSIRAGADALVFLLQKWKRWAEADCRVPMRALGAVAGFWLGWWVFESARVLSGPELAGTMGMALGGSHYGMSKAIGWLVQRLFSKQARSMEVDGATKMFETL